MAGFKSHEHRRKCLELVANGKMRPETFNQMDKETNKWQLPQRLHAKKEKVKTASSRKKLNG